jgi:predicted MFS family arabinose efflux permease
VRTQRLFGRFAAMMGGPARTRVIVILAAVLGLNSADLGAVGALANQLEQSLGISHTRLGLLATVSSAVGAIATIPVGVLADRSQRVRLLVITIGAWSAAMVASGLAVSYLWLLVSRLVLGIALGAANPIIASLTGDLFPPADRARVFGWILTGDVIGTGAGLVIAGDIGAALSWRYAFLLLAVASAGVALAVARLLPEPARGGGDWLYAEGGAGRRDRDPGDGRVDHDPGDGRVDHDPGDGRVDRTVTDRAPYQDPGALSLWRAMVYLLRIPTVRLLIIASSIGYFFFAGLRTFAVVFIERRFNVSQTELTGLVLVVGLATLAGLLAGGRLTDTLIDRGHASARVTVPAVAFTAAALLFIPGLYLTAIPLALATFSVSAAALAAANPPLDAARLDIVPGALWGRAESLRTVLRQAGEAAAPITFGFVADEFRGAGGRSTATGLRDAFLIMTIPLMINGVLVWMTRRTYPADVAEAAETDRRARS